MKAYKVHHLYESVRLCVCVCVGVFGSDVTVLPMRRAYRSPHQEKVQTAVLQFGKLKTRKWKQADSPEKPPALGSGPDLQSGRKVNLR